ncbi:MAG: chromosome partitioning protein [Pseudonocardiales bacterium]|nr:chromosome partitioning protein [Pseudonocardiales bacterium]
MLVVATSSLKGGVGKTTVALGLAGAAQVHGVRTLVVDLDPQANATVGLDAGPTAATVADVLDEPTRAVLRRAITPSGWGDGVDVLVGAEQTERHNRPDPGPAQLGRLARALDRLADLDDLVLGGPGDPADGASSTRGGAAGSAEPYRLVIVDCPPSLGQLTRGALAAADRALLVTDPTMFAVSGVQRAFDAVQAERERGNPHLQPLGVLINRVRPRNSEHAFRIAELRELFGPLVFSSVVPDRSAVQQAQGACLPIQRWDTPGAREVSAVFTTLLGRVLRTSRARPTPARAPGGRSSGADPAPSARPADDDTEYSLATER